VALTATQCPEVAELQVRERSRSSHRRWPEFFCLALDPPVDHLDLRSKIPIRPPISFSEGLDHGDGWDFTNADLIDVIRSVIARFEPGFRL